MLPNHPAPWLHGGTTQDLQLRLAAARMRRRLESAKATNATARGNA